MDYSKNANNDVIPPKQDDEYREVAWAIPEYNANPEFKPIWINRPNVRDNDVKFEMLYCGICHSDCHIGLNHMGPYGRGCNYPFVGGHELLGKVVEIGPKVTKFKIGDHVGVGCFTSSCLDCPPCKEDEENYCDKGITATYNGKKMHGFIGGNQETPTHGGYSGSNVIHEHFCVKIPENLPLDKSAPIMCAAITMYDPLRQHGATVEGKKMTIGVIGIGGLGTMGIKIARALGHDVVAISTSTKKEAMAKEKGATHFVVSTDEASIQACAAKCNIILNTVSAAHDVNVYWPLLAKNGIFVAIGANLQPAVINQIKLIRARQTYTGSIIGGIKATQEVLDLCAKHQIWPDCELVETDKIGWVWEQLNGPGGNKDGVRYVIDIKKSIANGKVPATE